MACSRTSNKDLGQRIILHRVEVMDGIVNEIWENLWIAQCAKKNFYSVSCNSPK